MNERKAQSAYTAEEIERFLGALDLEMVENLPAGKQEVARDVIAAVRAAVVEYGLHARYVANGVGKSDKAGTRTILDRNRAKLADHHAQLIADRHEFTVEEVADRSVDSGRSYTVACSCGWGRKGFEYNFTARQAGVEHRDSKGA